MSHALLVGPATVFTNTNEDPVLPEAGVLCSEDRIAEVGPWAAMESKHRGAQRLKADHRLVLPGLVNAHHHLYSTFARGMPMDPSIPPDDFVHTLEGIWWRLDRALDLEAVEAGAYPPLLDCLRWGTTTIIDHHASPNAIRGSLDALAQACDAVGIQASLCYEITDRNGQAGGREGIEENASFADACRDLPRLRALLGLHASFTVTDETLALAAERVGRPVHVHVAEAEADVSQTGEKFGRGILERLEAHGLLRPDSVLVHGVHLSETDLDRVAAADAWLVHNPDSNANNAVGQLDVLRALDRGVRVALGTDGMSGNMLGAAKAAYLMCRQVRGDSTVGFDLPRKLLFEHNALLARRLFGDDGIGTIAPGAPADLCLVDYDPPTPLTASTFDGHLIFGITEAPVLATVSAGRLRFVRGVMVDLDVERIRQRVQAAAAGVWERLRG